MRCKVNLLGEMMQVLSQGNSDVCAGMSKVPKLYQSLFQ